MSEALPSMDPAIGQAPPTTDQDAAIAADKRQKMLKSEADRARLFRRKLITGWSQNTDYRRGKPFSSESDNDRVAVNMDWMLTDQKHALLYSQTPRFYVDHPPQTQSKEFDGWLFKFEQKLNDTMRMGGLETAMDELIPDCINAAGIGIALAAHDAMTEELQVPDQDLSMLPPELQQMAMQSMVHPLTGQPIRMVPVRRVLDHRYTITRISPADFLWDLNFTGSDFNNCPWIGRDGRISWAEAMQRWSLKPEDRSQYVSVQPSEMTATDRINHDSEIQRNTKDDMVFFTEIFYKRHVFDTDVKKFNEIGHIVYLGGSGKPIFDKPWEGQQFDPQGNLIGAQRYPLQVLSLHYVTDDAVPPSDTAIGRPQVNELNRGRTQIIQQREYSRPSRWVDINRIDPIIMQTLLRGEWQSFIPVQGNGQNVIGEVSRANMSPESFTFDRTAKADLISIWNIGQEKSGAGVETSGEAQAIAMGAQTVIARQRARVGKFICNLAEVIGGLICIAEDPGQFGQGFDPLVSQMLACSIMVDSTVLLDSKQRRERIEQFLNFGAKTGYVEMEPVMREYAQLSTLDPSAVIVKPGPRPPEPPNISLRLTGTEDLLQPMTLAFMLASGQAPSTELIEQAKQLIASAVTPPAPAGQPPAGQAMGEPGGPGGPGGPMDPSGQMPPTDPSGILPVIPPPAPPPAVGDAMPEASALPKINQRIVERTNG